MRLKLLALAGVTIAANAQAEAIITIPLPVGEAGSISSQNYSCGDGTVFSVQYVNAGANMLAILPVDGDMRVFVNVLSASGARYASGTHIWWSKRDGATLEDELVEGSMVECALVPAGPD
ncbi:MAG TPA: hypothetical protein GX700_13735 [Paracoccus sp.]|nr:hypothetical protein [Paracoccus sp. (in: a-proteobacteria)]